MIDLSAYPRATLNAFHARGMACVYVVAYEAGKPCRIGYAKRPLEKIRELQRANAHKLELRQLIWVPSIGIARAIEWCSRDKLQRSGVEVDWHDVLVENAIAAVDEVVKGVYWQAENILTHDEMMKRLNGGGK